MRKEQITIYLSPKLLKNLDEVRPQDLSRNKFVEQLLRSGAALQNPVTQIQQYVKAIGFAIDLSVGSGNTSELQKTRDWLDGILDELQYI